jgi:glutamate--cysteine ligase
MPGPSAVDRVFERQLARLVNLRVKGALQSGLRGLEKEALRVTPDGALAQTPHPAALGSTLCNPHITTDYSESLIELVTPTFNDNAGLVRFLADLQQFVYRNLGDELLWTASMPCELSGDAEVPIARYGRSHQGHFKEVYRRGLLNRYGGMMQAIAGIHFNYSLPEGFWPLWAEVQEGAGVDAADISACCAISAVTAGSCRSCSAPRRRCAGVSCRSVPPAISGRGAPTRCTAKMPPACA